MKGNSDALITHLLMINDNMRKERMQDYRTAYSKPNTELTPEGSSGVHQMTSLLMPLHLMGGNLSNPSSSAASNSVNLEGIKNGGFQSEFNKHYRGKLKFDLKVEVQTRTGRMKARVKYLGEVREGVAGAVKKHEKISIKLQTWGSMNKLQEIIKDGERQSGAANGGQANPIFPPPYNPEYAPSAPPFDSVGPTPVQGIPLARTVDPGASLYPPVMGVPVEDPPPPYSSDLSRASTAALPSPEQLEQEKLVEEFATLGKLISQLLSIMTHSVVPDMNNVVSASERVDRGFTRMVRSRVRDNREPNAFRKARVELDMMATMDKGVIQRLQKAKVLDEGFSGVQEQVEGLVKQKETAQEGLKKLELVSLRKIMSQLQSLIGRVQGMIRGGKTVSPSVAVLEIVNDLKSYAQMIGAIQTNLDFVSHDLMALFARDMGSQASVIKGLGESLPAQAPVELTPVR